MNKKSWPHCELHDRNIIDRLPHPHSKCALADFGVLLRLKTAADKACAAGEHGMAAYLRHRYDTCFACETNLRSHPHIRFLRNRATEQRHAKAAPASGPSRDRQSAKIGG